MITKINTKSNKNKTHQFDICQGQVGIKNVKAQNKQ